MMHVNAMSGGLNACQHFLTYRNKLRWLCILALSLGLCTLLILANCRTACASRDPGDRITGVPKKLDDWMSAALPRDSYAVEAGDTLCINVQGRANLNYHVSAPDKDGAHSDEVAVTPDGNIFLPLVGKLPVTGMTATDIEGLIRSGLGKYIRQFDVSVSVSKIRTVNVWISGEVGNPGPQTMAAVSTVSLAALQAKIKPTGTTRRITLIRGETTKTVDLYKMMAKGDASDDVALKPNDRIHIPPMAKFVEISGEVMRPGRYEMVTLSGETENFRIRHLLELALGALPSAALDRCSVERIGHDGKKTAVNVSLRTNGGANDQDMVLQPGDVLVVPSISVFQPMVRLIGEFKGDGVYQRTPGSTKEDVQNRSGIYFLKKGQTVLDVIAATGGITPQADLTRARIERTDGVRTTAIPIDLSRMLVMDDRSVDVQLQSGDSLILPAVADKVHIFGQMKSPGSYTYSPNRRLVDYLGDAGGPTAMAKLTEINIVRGDANAPKLTKVNVKKAIENGASVNNPVLEPGDIVYVPAKFISDWRDGVQLIFTSLSLRSLLR